MKELDTFTTEVRAGRRRAAYDALCTAWRERRSPELGDLVDAAGAAFCDDAPIEAATAKKAFIDAWLARARTRAPYEVGWLLAQLERPILAKQTSLVAACLDEIVGTRGDPSVALPACKLVALPGGTVNFGAWGKVLTRLWKLIEHAGDPRAIAPLQQLASTLDAGKDGVFTPSTAAALRERIPKVVAQLAAHSVQALGQDELAQVRACRALLAAPLAPAVDRDTPPSVVDTLFAEVLANPDDEAAIAVWADALQQQGDPRGELAALQLAGKDNEKARKVAQKLVTKHWRTWVGPIAPAIVASTLEFERGLLAGCATDVRRVGVAKVIFEHPNWRTVRRIELRGYGHLSAAMPFLEEARSISDTALEKLDTVTLPRLRVLGLRRRADPNTKGIMLLLQARAVPALRVLATPDECRWLFGSRLAAQLETLQVGHTYWPAEGPAWITEWLALRKELPALREFHFEGAASTVRVDLIAQTLQLVATPSTPPYMVASAQAIARHANLRWITNGSE